MKGRVVAIITISIVILLAAKNVVIEVLLPVSAKGRPIAKSCHFVVEELGEAALSIALLAGIQPVEQHTMNPSGALAYLTISDTKLLSRHLPPKGEVRGKEMSPGAEIVESIPSSSLTEPRPPSSQESELLDSQPQGGQAFALLHVDFMKKAPIDVEDLLSIGLQGLHTFILMLPYHLPPAPKEALGQMLPEVLPGERKALTGFSSLAIPLEELPKAMAQRPAPEAANLVMSQMIEEETKDCQDALLPPTIAKGLDHRTLPSIPTQVLIHTRID